jgi:coenzyme F420-reducing hydrogenase delta subunit
MEETPQENTVWKIQHRLLFEESKITLAKSYKDDVRLLLDLLEQKTREVERLKYIQESADKIQKYLDFVDGVQKLMRELGVDYPVPCAG